MKVIPQILTFIVLVALGGMAYHYHRPFQDLVNDIIQLSGLTEPVQSEQRGQPEPVIAPPPVSRPEVATHAVRDGSKTQTRVSEKAEAPRLADVVSKPVDNVPTPTDVVSKLADVVSKPADVGSNSEQEKPVVVTPATIADSKTADAPATRAVDEVPAEPVVAPAVPAARTEDRPDIQQPTATQKPVAQKPATMSRVDAITSSEQPHHKTLEQQALAGLSEARTAWQQGDYDGAVARYIELMNLYPNHADFAGELGNIYYARGQRKLAVDAYAEAFSRLIRMNDYARAWKLLSVIRSMDYQRASQLETYFVR